MDEERRKARLKDAPGVMGMYARQLHEVQESQSGAAAFQLPGRAKLDRMFADEEEAESPSPAPSLTDAPAPLSEDPLVRAKLVPVEDKKPAPRKAEPDENTVMEIDPDLIDEWDLVDRPAEEFGDLSEMTLSISQQGQRIPILVRPKKGGRYELIYGRRRWTICRELGRKVKAFVRKLSDQEAFQEMVVENDHRQDISTWARAMSYQRALDRGLFSTQTALASYLGITKGALSNIMIYTKVPEDIAKAVGSFSRVGIHTVKQILNLADDQESRPHLIQLADKIRSGELGEKTLGKAIEKARNAPPTSDSQIIKDSKGEKLFSTRRTGRGVLQITFSKEALRKATEKELVELLAEHLK